MSIQEEKLLKNLENGKPVTVKFYENDKKVSLFIEKIVKSVLDTHKRSDLEDVILFCIKELIANAWNANIKTLYFEKNKLNINNFGEYASGLAKYKALIDQRGILDLIKELYSYDLWIKFNLTHSPDGIKFEVTNNTPIVDIEEKKMRLKLQKSKIYIDLVDYYQTQEGVDPEDDKMGLALITILMNRAKLDTSLFRIGTVNGITLSRIEVPLSEKYLSERASRNLVKNI